MHATVLWMDLLGYKSWLLAQHSLSTSASQLEEALCIAFETLATRYDSILIGGIKTHLISDTIIAYVEGKPSEAIKPLTLLYQLLAARLHALGLGIRGALAYGPIFIGESHPHLVLGSTIVKCAELEKEIDAFAVVIDVSFIEGLLKLCDQSELDEAIPYMPEIVISMKSGSANNRVIPYFIPQVAECMVVNYQSLIDAMRQEKPNSAQNLRAFIKKFIGSKHMIDTLIDDPAFFNGEISSNKKALLDSLERVKSTWPMAIQHAELMLSVHGGESVDSAMKRWHR